MLDTKQYQQTAKAWGNSTGTHKIYENAEIEQGHDDQRTKGEGEARIEEEMLFIPNTQNTPPGTNT